MLKEYTSAFGVSGAENEIRSVIKERVDKLGDSRIDRLGNLIVHKANGGKRIMLASHMDEVGFIVKKILDDGRIKFTNIGGIDARILISKRVVFGRNKVIGVIGSKPIHLQSASDRESPVPISELFIDIGAESKKEAEKYVKLGDYATFESEYVDMGRYIKAKALDDRAGCSVITEILEENYKHDLYGVFTVQEEIGIRGAGGAAFAIKPEYAIVIEGTTCADIAENENAHITSSGSGPAISIMDSTSSANLKFVQKTIEIAEKNNIPWQIRRGAVGGNDNGRIHNRAEGCYAITISVPTRYIHSPISMINKEDYKNTVKLIKCLLKSLEEEL